MRSTDPDIIVEQWYMHTVQKVWNALTRRQEMIEWYFPNIPDFQDKIGFSTLFAVESGDRIFTHEWKVIEVTPLKNITYSWSYKEYAGSATVSFILSDFDGGTRLRLILRVLEDFTSDIQEFKRESCIDGWNYFLKGQLSDYLNKKPPKVIALSKSPSHTFTKFNEKEIKLIEGLGVEGDAHMGKTIKHRSRVTKNPEAPNLRQIHLIHEELFDELTEKGFEVIPGAMGENITTRGVDLLSLSEGTKMEIGEAEIQITGLRNPCVQLNSIQPGLMNELVLTNDNGNIIYKAGIMAIVLKGGMIREGDSIKVVLPEGPYKPLEKV